MNKGIFIAIAISIVGAFVLGFVMGEDKGTQSSVSVVKEERFTSGKTVPGLVRQDIDVKVEFRNDSTVVISPEGKKHVISLHNLVASQELSSTYQTPLGYVVVYKDSTKIGFIPNQGVYIIEKDGTVVNGHRPIPRRDQRSGTNKESKEPAPSPKLYRATHKY